MASILSQEEIDKLLDCVDDGDWKVPRNIDETINRICRVNDNTNNGSIYTKTDDFLLRRINSQDEKIECQDNHIRDLENKLNQMADIVLENKREIEKLAKRNLTVNFQN